MGLEPGLYLLKQTLSLCLQYCKDHHYTMCIALSNMISQLENRKGRCLCWLDHEGGPLVTEI